MSFLEILRKKSLRQKKRIMYLVIFFVMLVSFICFLIPFFVKNQNRLNQDQYLAKIQNGPLITFLSNFLKK